MDKFMTGKDLKAFAASIEDSDMVEHGGYGTWFGVRIDSLRAVTVKTAESPMAQAHGALQEKGKP
jgi:hypothetical protein